MNTFELVRCSKNDVQVHMMFDEMVFDPSLMISAKFWPIIVVAFLTNCNFSTLVTCSGSRRRSRRKTICGSGATQLFAICSLTRGVEAREKGRYRSLSSRLSVESSGLFTVVEENQSRALSRPRGMVWRTCLLEILSIWYWV